MPIEVLIGVPGSGKTAAIIHHVERLRSLRKPVLLLLCSDGEPLKEVRNIVKHKTIVSRDRTQATIDHFISAANSIQLLEQLPAEPKMDLVFDEAQYFGNEILPTWKKLSDQGHRLLLSTPTAPQAAFLKDNGAHFRELSIPCNLLADRPATEFFVLPHTDTTLSVCGPCAEAIRQRAAASISADMIAGEPYKGEPKVYQPVDIDRPEFSRLQPIRPDSPARVTIMTQVLKEHFSFPFAKNSRSYLDVGCNIGFFCVQISRLGFKAKGVDVAAKDIEMGRLLDRFFYQRHVDLVCENAINFLNRDNSSYDVTSTFSVFQWLYMQCGKEQTDRALKHLFDKTKHILFFEMGYQNEAHYAGRLAEPIDREWCQSKLEDAGFKHIRLIPEGTNNLKRDLFVAIR